MAKATWIKVGLGWKQVTNIWRKDGAVWKDKVISWRKISTVWKDCMTYPSIQTDKIALLLPWQRREWTEYCAINVTPDTMSTTITKIDTGDGTSWAIASPALGTGDYSFRGQATADNGGTPRGMIFRISDDAGLAASVDVSLTQDPQPI